MSPEEQKANLTARKKAYRRALQRLANEYRIEYRALAEQVRVAEPARAASAICRKAQQELRKCFPKRFFVIYNEEKAKDGIPVAERDWDEIAELIVKLYGNGKGTSHSLVAKALGVSKVTVERRLREHRKKTDDARRKNAESEAESCRDGDGPPLGGGV